MPFAGVKTPRERIGVNGGVSGATKRKTKRIENEGFFFNEAHEAQRRVN
jgi:hypothetical protein